MNGLSGIRFDACSFYHFSQQIFQDIVLEFALAFIPDNFCCGVKLGGAEVSFKFFKYLSLSSFRTYMHTLLDHSLSGAFQGQWKQIMQINITWLRIPTGRRQTSWLFTNVAEELNWGLPRNNSS